jgi:hypothetical protein
MYDVYSVYKVDLFYWKIVGILRKFLVVVVIRLVSSDEALMQAYLLAAGKWNMRIDNRQQSHLSLSLSHKGDSSSSVFAYYECMCVFLWSYNAFLLFQTTNLFQSSYLQL